MRTKAAIYWAWIFSIFAVFAHIAAMISFLTKSTVLGADASWWMIASISEALIATLGYLDHFAHKTGAFTGRPNE